MLLERLRDYSVRLELPPTMYLSTPIRWLIDLDGEGRFLGFISTAGGNKRQDRGIPRLAPRVHRSSKAVRPYLLADNAEYTLGLARDGNKPEDVRKRHAAFVAMVKDCAEQANEPSAHAVLCFLENLKRDRLQLPADFNRAFFLTFRVDGFFPIDLPTIQSYWAETSKNQMTKKPKKEKKATLSAVKPSCLICGQERPAVPYIPVKIKGTLIPNGQTSGMALVSTEKEAFKSYGLGSISCVPICAECGERFIKAANALLEGEDTHIRIGPVVYLFWTRTKDEFRPGKMLSQPQAEQVKTLYAAAWKADPSTAELDANKFYATAFSASGGRVVVRDWLETTVATAKRHLARYFTLQTLVAPKGAEGEPIGLYALAASTVRDANRDLPANVPRALLRLALQGGPLPDWILFQAVKRNRAEQKVTRPRAALIKMVLLSQLDDFPKPEEKLRMNECDVTNHEPAYLCGRLLAVLERVQKIAIPGAKATITDRFFGTASSAPASVFGRLLRLSQSHLGKLRKGKPGACAKLQECLEEIQKDLTSFPRTLTLQQQGLFSLGYYHQRAKDRGEAKARKQAKQNQA